MLQEPEVASRTPRGAYDLVSLWAELRMVVVVFCCGNHNTCTLSTCGVTTLSHKAFYSPH